jgi:hypothetical protein
LTTTKTPIKNIVIDGKNTTFPAQLSAGRHELKVTFDESKIIEELTKDSQRLTFYQVKTELDDSNKKQTTPLQLPYQKQNASLYRLTLPDSSAESSASSSAYILRFNQTFDTNWKLYLTDSPQPWWKVILQQPVTEDRHFKLDTFANGWLIEKSPENTQPIYATILFKPQLLFYVGAVISGITLLGSVFALTLIVWRKKGHRV